MSKNSSSCEPLCERLGDHLGDHLGECLGERLGEHGLGESQILNLSLSLGVGGRQQLCSCDDSRATVNVDPLVNESGSVSDDDPLSTGSGVCLGPTDDFVLVSPNTASDSNPKDNAAPDRLHRILNFTLNKLLLTSPPRPPREYSTSSLISSQSQIFERSINLSGFISPETPQHYNLENFTNPILDTTTELIADPKFSYKHIKLNCYDEEVDEEEEEAFIPRSRSRSIISNSLMNSLGGCKHEKMSCCSNPKESTPPDSSMDELNQLPGDDKDITIDFYSFADMLCCEDNVGRERKGSCYTISAKDYIGIWRG